MIAGAKKNESPMSVRVKCLLGHRNFEINERRGSHSGKYGMLGLYVYTNILDSCTPTQWKKTINVKQILLF